MNSFARTAVIGAALSALTLAACGSASNAAAPTTNATTTTTTLPPTTTLSPAARARQQAAAKAAAAKAARAAAAAAAARAAAAAKANAARVAAAARAAAAKAAAAAAAQAAYLKSITPVVLWQQSGSGQASGQQFTVPGNIKGWKEVWTYDCSGFGSNGNFITNINGSTSDPGNNQLGSGGGGTNYYYDSGTFSIDVNSECSWTDQAVTVPV